MNIAINNKVASSYKVSIFYLILLCIVAGAGWFGTRYLGDKARQEILQFNESTILTHSSHFSDEFEHIEREVRVLSGSPLIAPALISRKDEDIANANSTLDRYNSGLGSSVSYLMDSNGMTIASSNRNDPDSFVGKYYHFRPYFIQAMKDAPGRYCALGVTSLKRGFYASYPVKDDKGHIIGVVVIKKDIDEKEADLSRYPYFFLVDPNGIIFLSSRKEMTFKSLWPISRETRLTLLISGQFGEREFDALLPRAVVDGMEIKLDGRNYLASRKVIDPEGWSTVIMTSTEKIVLYKLAGVIISMWICTLIVVPMIINYRTSRSAEMVRASETRYRELFDNTSSGVGIYEVKDGGKDFILKDFNKAGERIDGARKEDIIGKSIHEVRPGIKEFGLLDVFERVWKTGIPEHHLASFYHDQKTAVWFENFVYKLPTGEMVAVYDDITGRMRAEEALRESEEKYRRIVETANEGICVTDVDNLVTYVNQKMADMLGYLPEEIIGKPLVHFLFPEDLADHQEKWSHRIQGLSETYERRFRRNDGRERWTNVSVTVIRTEDGGFMGAFGMLTDITERKRAQEELKDNEQLLKSIIQGYPIPTFMIGKDHRVIHWNRALEEFTGVGASAVIGTSQHWRAFYREARPCMADLLVDENQEGAVRWYGEGTGKSEVLDEAYEATEFFPDLGETGKWLHFTAAAVRNSRGAIVGAIEALEDITDRKQVEEALRESENHYKAIFENTGTATLILEEDTIISLVNAEFEKLTGYTRDEIENKKSWTEFVVKEDLERMLDQHRLRRAVGKAALKQYEFRLIDRHDRTRDCLLTVDMIADTKRSIASFLDITERRQAEAALRESEELYRTLVSLSPDAISVADLNGLLTFTSPKAIQMFGYSPDDEILGHSILSWVAPEEQENVSTNMRRFLTEGTLTATEYTLIKKDGAPFIGELNAAVIHSHDGSPMSMIIITRDITERKQAEIALHMSEERFSRFFRSTPVGTSITRLSDGQLVDANDAFLGLLGYTREEVISQNTLKLKMWANPEDKAKVIEILQEKGNIKDFEIQLVRKSGEIIDVLGSAEVIEMAEEKYMLSLAYDITERKRGEKERKKLEEQLFQAQKMESVGRLAGGVAHDFNNMLGVIIGRAEMALELDLSTDKLQHNLKEILKAGLRSADLTRQLLAYARKQTAAPKILDLNGTISGMLNMLRRLIGEDIDLLWIPELDLWKVKIDPSQVDQILANLAVNARDAISGVGAITMRTDNVVIDDSNRAETPEFIPGEYVLLTVNDTGAGMSQEVRKNIFEPFFTTKELGKGTGLGLSTVYGIVKQNDGFVYVASEPGKGTTFKIYLPRFEAETVHVPSEEITVKRPTGTETILLVEDDEAILNLGKMILENLGYTVLAAGTPVDAIHLVEKHSGDIHLLITDVVMPEMNGRELAEQLSAIRPNLECLYMSGYTADVIAHRGILDEGVGFIQKPFLSEDLAAKVRQVLDHLE